MGLSRTTKAHTLVEVRKFLESPSGKTLLNEHGFRRALPFTPRAYDEKQVDVPSISLYRKGIRGLGKPAVSLSIVDYGTRLVVKHDGKTLSAIRRLTSGIHTGIGIENFEHQRFSRR